MIRPRPGRRLHPLAAHVPEAVLILASSLSRIASGRPAAVRATVVAAVLTVAAGGAREASAQQPPDSAEVCPQGRISHIFVDNHSIFDMDKLGNVGALRWAYGLANGLHVTTRESFIRRELLFDVGDCYDSLLVEESGRILRNYIFIAQADVYGVRQPDGTMHVVVDTQDEWTTQVDMSVSFDQGFQLEGLVLRERNLLGRGVEASAFLKQRKERQDVGARIQFPRLFGSRADAGVGAGRTRSGNFANQSLTYPFVGEVGRFALREVYGRRDELFQYSAGIGRSFTHLDSAGIGRSFTHLVLPLLDQRIELSAAARIGKPGSLTLLGAGILHETLDYGGFPGSLQLVMNGDFGNPLEAPGELAGIVIGQTAGITSTRINLMIGQRDLRFRRIRGLDALRGAQDVQLGTDVGFTVGRSIGLFRGNGPDVNDLYTRLRIFAGDDPGTGLIFLNVGLEGRQVFSGGRNGNGWRDIIGEFDFYGYARSGRWGSHTLFGRVSAAGGWTMDKPFQLTLGGRDGVRGFREEVFPGAQRVLISLEDRVYLPWPAPKLFDMGLTFFADAGRMWAGGAPFGTDSGWRGTLGAGLRLGFPSGTRGVGRIDLAFPVGSGPDHGPIFRISLFERLGIFPGFEDPQLRRSRRTTVGPDSFVPQIR